MTHKDVFRLLFYSGDHLCYGDAYATSVMEQPDGAYEFFCINPLHPSYDYQKSTTGLIERLNGNRRADLNVIRFQNFLFEMDNVSLDQQLVVFKSIEAAGIPIASLVYSGGKSYHGIVSLENPLAVTPHTFEALTSYKDTWMKMALYLSKLAGFDTNIFDTACQNASRLSRFPTFQAPDRARQDIISIGRLLNDAEFAIIVNAGLYTPIKRQVYAVRAGNASSDSEMKAMMPAELAARLKFPAYWAKGEAGNYPELFKLVLWMYDATGATRELVTDYMERHTIPKLVAMGYPAEKVYKVINDAFLMKGE